MGAATILMTLIAAAALEAKLLYEFFFHPAWGSTTEQSQAVWIQFLIWAAVPLILSALLVAASWIKNRPVHSFAWPLLFVAAIGPLLALIALHQLSHGAPVFLLIGFVLQCGAWLYAIIKSVKVP